MGRNTHSRFYNNSLACARPDSSCVPDSVLASLACSNNLHAATSSNSTEDVSVLVLARDNMKTMDLESLGHSKALQAEYHYY